MTSYPILNAEFQRFLLQTNPLSELHVAFSGGLDSTVLLHLLVNAPIAKQRVLATYIDHQLQPQSSQWARHCKDVCAQWQVAFNADQVTLENTSRQGVEALARKARYKALYQRVSTQGVLLTAHHQQDQAETFLLNLSRGSGVSGLAAMPYKKTLTLQNQKQVVHIRPLLHVPYVELVHYAKAHQLSWIEDPSNQDPQFKRNQIRWQVLPQIEQAWSNIQRQIERVVAHQSEAVGLLKRLATQDRQLGEYTAHSIHLNSYAMLDWPSLKNVLSDWARRLLNISLTYDQLLWIKAYGVDLQDSSAQRLIKNGSLNLYRNTLYFVGDNMHDYKFNLNHLTPLNRNKMAHFKTPEKEFVIDIPSSWLNAKDLKNSTLTVRSISKFDDYNAKRLKKWFQQHGIPKWYRPYWPVICKNDQAFLLWGAQAIFNHSLSKSFNQALSRQPKAEQRVQFTLTQTDVVNFATQSDRQLTEIAFHYAQGDES